MRLWSQFSSWIFSHNVRFCGRGAGLFVLNTDYAVDNLLKNSTSYLHAPHSKVQRSCNIPLQEWEPCHPIKLQKDLNSALCLAHTVDAVVTQVNPHPEVSYVNRFTIQCGRTSCPTGHVVLGPNVPCQDGMSHSHLTHTLIVKHQRVEVLVERWDWQSLNTITLSASTRQCTDML